MNSYIKVNTNELEIVESLLTTNDIEYTTSGDPMMYVCEELVDSYIENVIEEGLRPLFRKAENELVETLYEEASTIFDDSYTIDVLAALAVDIEYEAE